MAAQFVHPTSIIPSASLAGCERLARVDRGGAVCNIVYPYAQTSRPTFKAIAQLTHPDLFRSGKGLEKQDEITLSRRWKKWRLALLILGIVVAGCVLFGPRLIHFYFISQAEKLLENKQFKVAEWPIQRALKFQPDSIQACEMMAEVGRGLNSPEELSWRKKLTTLKPGDTAAQLSLAVAAARYGDLSLASTALDAVPARDQNFEYHTSAGSVAYSLGIMPLARKHFTKAYEMSPNDQAARLNYEKVQLQARDNLSRNLARDAINELTEAATFRLSAYRILLNDAQRSGDEDAQKRIHKTLRDLPESTFQDRLLYLSDLHHAKDPEFTNELSKRINDARLSPENVYSLMIWMNGEFLYESTLAWYEKLPISIQLLPSTKLVVAEAGIALHAWDKVEKLVAPPPWYHLEHLRHAIQARCYIARHGARDAEFNTLWSSALTEAGDEYRKVQMLARLAEAWDWWKEAEQLWWTLAKKPDIEMPTLKHLYDIYRKQSLTPKMLDVSKMMLTKEPDNLEISNNVVRYSILLGYSTPDIFERARINFEKAPEDWTVRTTYAMALLFQDKPEEAGQLLRDAPPAVERNPSLAAYFGITFTLSGRTERGRLLLHRATESPLLPEERSLVLQALAR